MKQVAMKLTIGPLPSSGGKNLAEAMSGNRKNNHRSRHNLIDGKILTEINGTRILEVRQFNLTVL